MPSQPTAPEAAAIRGYVETARIPPEKKPKKGAGARTFHYARRSNNEAMVRLFLLYDSSHADGHNGGGGGDDGEDDDD